MATLPEPNPDLRPACPLCDAEMPVAEREIYVTRYACWLCRVTVQFPVEHKADDAES